MVFKDRSEHLQWGVFAIDLAVLALYVWLAMRSSRHWPLFAAGFQLLAIVTHIGRAVDTAISGWAYLTAGLIWSYLVVAAIGYGSWTAQQPEQSDKA